MYNCNNNKVVTFTFIIICSHSKKGHKKTQKNDTTKKYASGESLKTRNEIIEI